MLRYMKRAAQIVVLTGALVFSGLLIGNTSIMTKEAEAVRNHQTERWHVHLLKYYTGKSNGQIYHRWEWRYYWHANYR